MKKSWHNPREVIVQLAPVQPDDCKRAARLINLLATGMDRLLAARSEKAPTSLDFMGNVLPNTTNVNEPAKMENE